MGDTVLLVAAVAKKSAEPGRGFFPLTVNYQEKTASAGKIPGGYFKREGRPTEKETLTSRLIDRALRPLFPKGFENEVQIIVTLMSLDPAVSPDIPAIMGCAAALSISGMPFQGPVAAARVGYQNGQYLLNPAVAQLKESQLDLVVAATTDAVIMVESEAKELSEEEMLSGVIYGQQEMQVVNAAIADFAASVTIPAFQWEAQPKDDALYQQVVSHVEADLKAAYQIKDKMARNDAVDALAKRVVEAMSAGENEASKSEVVLSYFHALAKQIVREQVLSGQPRIDGRTTEDIRQITPEVTVLPRTHGSALFTRGETQAFVTCTLGTEKDSQIIDDLVGEYRDHFMLHYNFPPYCVGEVGFMSGPKRREIGHGKLAKRAMNAVVPTMDEFPYVLRVVSDITESNGSSSMASVCGTSLAMMDAGVPIKAPVAGIAMGLIKEGNRYAILSDILGDEDHLGDMDFKVAGTQQGITALQMDIKINGITEEIMKNALSQAKTGRFHILNEMKRAIDAPRQDISLHAPRILTIKIHPDKIRDVIGKGGAVIREITEQTNSVIDISDDGLVKIAAVSGEDGAAALKRVQDIIVEAEVGKIYEGKVVNIVDFGAFVEILPGKQGLVHVSQIAQERVENVRDHLSEDQIIRVKVVEIGNQGRIRLTMKEIDQ
jgi:polyribonucleotide nucleotidyltransferase